MTVWSANIWYRGEYVQLFRAPVARGRIPPMAVVRQMLVGIVDMGGPAAYATIIQGSLMGCGPLIQVPG